MYALEVKRISNLEYSNILHINDRINEYKYYSLVKLSHNYDSLGEW